MDILSLFIFIPLLILVGLAFANKLNTLRSIMLIGSGSLVFLALTLAVLFSQARDLGDSSPLLFTTSISWYEPFNLSYSVGIDAISLALLLLSSVIFFASTWASWTIAKASKAYFLCLTLLSIGVFGFFISTNLFTMFFFYELALIPKFLLIGIWGYGKNTYAALKLALILIGGSALILIGILGVYFDSGATTMIINDIANQVNGAHIIAFSQQLLWYPCLFIGFGILATLFPFHTWSIDVYASAPTGVSMLHAGILTKLGTYGCFRVAMYLLPDAAHELNWIFLILTAFSVVYAGLSACVQTDLRYINAYASISHCALILFALLMCTETSVMGAVLQMVSHGLITALCFGTIGMLYQRTHTYDVRLLGGLMRVLPFLSVSYIIAGLASIGVPGFSGFVAEMTIFVGAFEQADPMRRTLTIVVVSSIVIAAVYVLRAIGRVVFGVIKNESYKTLTDATWQERIPILCLTIAILALGVFPTLLSDLVLDAVTPLIEHIGKVPSDINPFL